MNGVPRVSVVLPVFNGASSIAAAIRSVQAQTLASVELLVIDDGSTDSTPAIVTGIAAADPRVRLLRAARNAGPSAARNRGLGHATGEFVALLDADDRYDPRRLDMLAAEADARRADLISDNLLLCPDGDAARGTAMIPDALLPSPCRLTAAEFVARNTGSRRDQRIRYGYMKPLFRRAFLEANALRYEERNRFGEDFLLYLDCLIRGAAWWMIPQPLYQYNVRQGSLTNVQSAGDLDRIRTAEKKLLEDPRTAADPALRRALRRHKAGIDRNYHYRAFTDALKARRLRNAASLLFAGPESLQCIAREGLAQAPAIAAKALRGGYRTRGTEV